MTPWAKMMAERQAAGLCRHCGKPRAPGCALCELHRDRERARRRAKYAARKAAGKCIESACNRKAVDGHIRCKLCHEKYTIYCCLWQRENRRKERERTREPASPPK